MDPRCHLVDGHARYGRLVRWTVQPDAASDLERFSESRGAARREPGRAEPRAI